MYCVLPVFIGGIIYVCFRSDNLLMFNWFELIGISKNINELRNTHHVQNIVLYDWIKFSLPDALWLFSMINSILFIWDFSIKIETKLWLAIIISIGLFSELGQLICIIPGTFDFLDLCLIIVFTISPFIIFKKQLKFK